MLSAQWLTNLAVLSLVIATVLLFIKLTCQSPRLTRIPTIIMISFKLFILGHMLGGLGYTAVFELLVFDGFNTT